MRCRRSAAAVAVLAVLCLQPARTADAAATDWPVTVTSSTGEGRSTAPGTPAPTAICSALLGTQIMVSWPAVAAATSYTVYESTTSATSGFSVLTTTSGLSTRTGSLGVSTNYWFEVSASITTTWTGPSSAATGETTLTLTLCTQP